MDPSNTGRWRRRALPLVLAGLMLPIGALALARRSRSRSTSERLQPARPDQPASLWHQSRGGHRPIDPFSSARRAGPTPATPPATPPAPPSAAAAEHGTQGLSAELVAALQRVGSEDGAEGAPATETAEGDLSISSFLEDAPGSGRSESAFGRLASKMVGAAVPADLGRDRKLQAARLFMVAGRDVDAWNLLSTERARHLGPELAIEAAMAAIAADRAADGLAWLGDEPPAAGDRAAYWWARLAQRAGEQDLARPVLEEIVERQPAGYYGIWAAARLRDPGALGSPVILDGRATRDSSDLPARSVTLAEMSGLVRRHGAGAPSLGRALDLARAGSDVAAFQELRLGYRQRSGAFDRADEASLTRIARMLGDEELALRLDPPRDPRQYHRHAWRSLVIAAAARRGVDPDLVWAVMLRESRFHPNAASPVGAVGLMQLMPATGRAIAHELRMQGYQNESLEDPDCSIDFGAFLLSALLRRYDQNVSAALAAYNAGIGPVDEWLAHRRAGEGDAFAELIPYPETQRYVRRVLVSLAIYQTAL